MSIASFITYFWWSAKDQLVFYYYNIPYLTCFNFKFVECFRYQVKSELTVTYISCVSLVNAIIYYWIVFSVKIAWFHTFFLFQCKCLCEYKVLFHFLQSVLTFSLLNKSAVCSFCMTCWTCISKASSGHWKWKCSLCNQTSTLMFVLT